MPNQTEPSAKEKAIGVIVLAIAIPACIFFGLWLYDYQHERMLMGGDTIINCEHRVRSYPELAPSFIQKLEDGRFTQLEYDEFMVEYSKAVAKDVHDREVNYEEMRQRIHR